MQYTFSTQETHARRPAPGYGRDVADSAYAFDTLAAAEALSKAGSDDAQAKAVVATVRRAEAGLATRADFEAGLANPETRLTVRLFGGLLATVAAAALLTLLA